MENIYNDKLEHCKSVLRRSMHGSDYCSREIEVYSRKKIVKLHLT